MANEEIEKTKYVYTNPGGATFVWSEKPKNWERLVGKKEAYNVRVPKGTTEKAISGYIAQYHKGETERAEKFFAAHAHPHEEKAAPQQPKFYAYEGEAAVEQIRYIRERAAELGARVEVGDITRTKEGDIVPYKIISKTPLAKGDEGFSISIPSRKAIREARIRKERRFFAQKTAAETIKKHPLAASVKTLLGPQSYEAAGAVFWPEKKSVSTVIHETIAKEHEINIAKPEETVAEKAVRSTWDTINSLPFEYLTTFSLGAGLSKLAATKIGVKVLSSTAGKVALTAGGAIATAPSVVDIYQTKVSGRHEEAVGKAIGLGGSLVAGSIGFGLGYSRAMKNIQPKVIDASKITGRSITVTDVKTGKSASLGEFYITKGPAAGTKGYTLGTGRMIGKKTGIQYVVTYIPEQKVKMRFGRTLKVKSSVTPRAGRTIKIKGKTGVRYTGKMSEGVIDTQIDDVFSRALAGTKRGSTQLIEQAKAAKGAKTYRYFTGSGTETTGDVGLDDILRSVRLAGKGKAKGARLDVPRTKVRMTGMQDIEWVDVSIRKPSAGIKPISGDVAGISPKGPPKPKGRAGALLQKPVTETTPPVPTSVKVEISPKIKLPSPAAATATATASLVSKGKAKVIPSYHYSPGIVKRKPEYFTISTPKIVQTLQKGQEVITAAVKPMTLPKVVSQYPPRFDEKLVPDIISTPTTTTEEEEDTTDDVVTIVKTITTPVTDTDTDHMPPASIFPEIPPPPPPPRFPQLPMGLRVRFGKSFRAKYKTRWIKNPVPEKLKIKMPKIRKIV